MGNTSKIDQEVSSQDHRGEFLDNPYPPNHEGPSRPEHEQEPHDFAKRLVKARPTEESEL